MSANFSFQKWIEMSNPRCAHPGCLKDPDERYSLGIYAGQWCDNHWETSGYRKDDASGFDPDYAGESYDPD